MEKETKKYLTTYEELLENKGNVVRFTTKKNEVFEGRIQVEGTIIYVCQNEIDANDIEEYKFGYKYAKSVARIWNGKKVVFIGEEFIIKSIELIENKNMDKKITTHEQLLKLHGKKITCDIKGEHINDARISVENKDAYVCQNTKYGTSCKEKFGYKYSWCISSIYFKIEEGNSSNCTNIKLVEEEQEDLDLDKAIDDITPKQIITPPNHYKLEINNQVVDVNMILEAVAKKLEENKIKCSLIEFNYYFQAVKYLLRCYFKHDKVLDLKKCISEIENILTLKQ